MREIVGRHERQDLVAHAVTLNGERAVICGVSLDFPRIVATASGISGEWSWIAVRRIVAAGGRFAL